MTSKPERLVAGKVDRHHLELLIKLSGIHTEAIIQAVFAHLVDGGKQSEICSKLGLKPPLLSRKLSDLRRLSEAVEELSVFYR